MNYFFKQHIIIGLWFINAVFAQFNLIEKNEDKTTFQFIQENVIFESYGEYTKLIPSKYGTTTNYGQPELPLYSTLIQVKPDKEYYVNYKIISSHTVSDIKVFPFQHKDNTETNGTINYVDASLYHGNVQYPESILSVSDRLIFRDLHLLNISLVPYRYKPHLALLEVIDNIEIEITETGIRDTHDERNRPSSKVFEKLYSTLVLNVEHRNHEDEFQNPSILYICGGNSENHSAFQQLVNWRHQRGYVVYTASLSEAGNSANAIKNYIQNAYYNFDPPPEYVAFVGDVGGSYSVPTFYECWGHNDYGGQCEGDQPYSELDGNDLFPEILTGRISVRSSSELSAVVNKIIHYEKGTYASTMLPYYEKAALIGDPTTASGYSTVITNEFIAELLTNYEMDDVRLKVSGGGWSNWMQNQLNEGVLYFNYRGIYGVSGFSNGHIDNANNGFKLPLATIITCGTGSFAQHNTSLSEKFLRAGSLSNPKGGIAGIATATLNTHTLFNNIINMGIYDGIFAHQIETAGGSLAHGKLTLFNAYPTNPYNWINAFTQWNNLMGDPSTHLWTDTPIEISVQFENEISFGTNFIDVHVSTLDGSNLEHAMVTLLKGNDEIFMNEFTDENGNVAFHLDYDTGGTVQVTVTHQNVIPNIGSFDITSSGKLINIDPSQPLSINDGENGNGILNPGDSIYFQIPLRNFGSIDVSGVHASLTSSSTSVTLIDHESNYGTIETNSYSIGDGFELFLSPATLEGEDLEIRIHISDDSGLEWEGIVPMVVSGGNLTVETVGFIEKNQTADIQISVKNTGSITLENLSAELSYNGGIVDIIDNTGDWGNIQPNESKTCSNCFTISAGNHVVNGSIIPLNLQFYNAEGVDIEQIFNLKIGEVSTADPTGPDQYGYYMYDLSDVGYNIALDYNWIEIDPEFGGSGMDLNLSDNGNGNFSNSSVWVELPFTFRFYGVDYDDMTINSNGWISMGETDMESFRNYPIPGAGGPSPMIAAFWDDLKTAYGGDVIYFESPDSQYVIVEWSNLRTHNQNSIESFQVILYNSQSPPFGDGNIKIQYKVFNNTSSGNYISGTPIHGGYSTIGIENRFGTDGLEYTFNNNYSPSATELENETALLITTSIFEQPTARYEFDTYNYSVFFNDLSSEGNFIDLTEWIWDFGDGTISDERSPIHYYSEPGSYEVSLTVSSSSGLISEPSVANIIIETCTDSIDDCGVCGGSNIYMDCNGQCGMWTPICSDEHYEGYLGPQACEGYIGIGSDYLYAENNGNDYCGECQGDNTSCTGCTNPDANNYDPDNIFEDGSCTFVFYGPGRAIQFDGEEDYIDINGNTIGSVFGENSSDFTISMWVFPDTVETNIGNQILVSHTDSSGNKNFELGMSPLGNINVFIQNGCGDNELSFGSGEFVSSYWHYLTVTFSSGIVSAFLDGIMYSGQTCGETLIPIESAKMTLGKSPINELFFNGILDEIRIYNYSLNLEEIQSYMNNVINPQTDGLIAYWRFDELEGDITFDATSGNNDGQLMGTPNRLQSTVPFIIPGFTTLTATTNPPIWPIDLVIGMIPEATNEYDPWVDRYAPPPPPPPAWDVAIYNTIINDRLFVDIRPETGVGNVTEWTIEFQPDTSTQEFTLSWNPNVLDEGTYMLSDPFGGLFFSVDMREMEQYSFSSEFSQVIIKHSLNTGLLISHTDDWNLVGLPLYVMDNYYELVYPDAIEGTLFSFHDGYLPVSNLEVGDGYWLRFPEEGSSTISGMLIHDISLHLNEGWNLISGLSESISIYLVFDPDSIIVPSTLYRFVNSYEETDVIYPGEGYWIRSFQDGEISFSSDSSFSNRLNGFEGSTSHGLNTLTFQNTTLFFGGPLSSEDFIRYSLPPKPPIGASDFRFKGDRKHVTESGEIEVMSTSEFLSISYDIKISAGEDQHWVLLSENGEKFILKESGILTVPSAEILYLSKEQKIPISFYLHQNFPNPFNPKTTISYDLPEDIFVKLTIFDILGREIAILVNENQKAGFKTIQWDGQDQLGESVGGGVYLCQIEAGNFIQTKKMVLLK